MDQGNFKINSDFANFLLGQIRTLKAHYMYNLYHNHFIKQR